MTATEEPMLSRLNRLDNILKQLEGIRSVNQSPKSSSTSNLSSGTMESDSRRTSAEFSPESHCRPIDEVIMEVEQKGTLIDRLVRAEDRILELCLSLQEDLEASSTVKRSPRKGLKNLVRSCVGADVKYKTKE